MKLSITPRYNWNKIFRTIYPNTFDKSWLDDLFQIVIENEESSSLGENVTEKVIKTTVSFSTEKLVVIPTGLQLKESSNLLIESLIPGCEIKRYFLPGFESDLILSVTNKDNEIKYISEFEEIAKIREC